MDRTVLMISFHINTQWLSFSISLLVIRISRYSSPVEWMPDASVVLAYCTQNMHYRSSKQAALSYPYDIRNTVILPNPRKVEILEVFRSASYRSPLPHVQLS